MDTTRRRNDQGRDPDMVICGAMRSGTTALTHWLKQHPDVYMPPVKELHYFDQHYDRGPGWYRRQFAGAGPGRVCGESTPAYLYLAEARQRMVHDLPEARFIVSLRNPADRAWSHYLHNRERGKEPLDFAAALEAEPDRLRRPEGRRQFSYLDRGRYAAQLADLVERAGSTRVLVLVFETDVRSDPRRTYARVTEFLGLDAHEPPREVGRTVNASRAIRSPRVRRLALRLPGLAQDVVARFNTSARPLPSMPDELRRVVLAELEADIAVLERATGLDLAHWRP